MHSVIMIKALALLITFTLFLSMVRSASLPARSFTVVPLTWQGQHNGQAWEFNGTASEVYDQLQGRFPDYQLKEHNLKNRAVLNKVQPPICVPVPGQNWNWAYIPAISQSIGYLIGIAESVTIKAGPGICGLLNCVGGSRIWLCNDNTYSIKPNSIYLASYAQDIIDSCQLRDHNDAHLWFAGGQEFDTDRYNIVVNGEGLGVEIGSC